MKAEIKRRLGSVLTWLRPDIVRRIESDLADVRMPGQGDTLVERLIVQALLARRMASGAEDAVVRSHKTFWTGDHAVAFHGRADDRVQANVAGMHRELFDEFERVLATGRYNRLCEIGCGSGVLVHHLAQRLPTVAEVVGLDLSPEQVNANQARYANPRLTFVAADAAKWVPAHARAGTAYLTYDGVLEYFSQEELEAMLRSIARHAPVCFALVEPISPDYDLDQEVQSRLYGREMAVSHNYPRLFAAASFEIRWLKEIPRARYVMMIACKDA